LVYNIVYKTSVLRDLAKLFPSGDGGILNQIDSALSRNGDSCPVLKGKSAGLRRFVSGNYRVIFAIIKDEIIVLRISRKKKISLKNS